MKETCIKVPSELFALAESSRFEGTADLHHVQVGPDDYEFSKPLAWQVDVTNTGAALLVAGSVTGTGTSACARCLDNVAFDFNGAIEGYFLIEGAEAPDAVEEDDPLADEFDVLPSDHIIDLENLIVAALMVDAPQQPLCKEDCAGLCPTCGANLNEGDCGCGQAEDIAEFNRAANPFAALADFKFQD